MSFLTQPLTNILFGPTRSFGTQNNLITGYITIKEDTTDAMEITQQPVQQGASISDHAFQKPTLFNLQMIFGTGLLEPSLAATYQKLLNLQLPTVQQGSGNSVNTPSGTLTPFNITTPKRTYYNMLLTSISVTTDKKTENVLAVNAAFQQVILVPITTVTIPASQLRSPGVNSGVQNVGNQSALSSIVQGLGGPSSL